MSKSTPAPWYGLSERAGVPLVTSHPRLVGSGITLRQVRRAISLRKLVATTPGLYTLIDAEAVDGWIDSSRTDASQ